MAMVEDGGLLHVMELWSLAHLECGWLVLGSSGEREAIL
jgi:hypothetical protein